MHSTPPSIDTPPNPSSLSTALTHPLYDSSSQPTTLSTILSSHPTSSSRVLILFIRNFLCGNCQQFLLTLTSLLPPHTLPNDTSIIIIGCGAPSLIPSYIEITQCPYPIYTDPTNTLYSILGMQRSLSLGNKAPDYIKQSLVLGAMKSIVQGIKRVNSGDMLAAGEMSVNGGEFLFVRKGSSQPGSSGTSSMEEIGEMKKDAGSEWNVTWCHRMRNTRDHTEIPDLMRVLGVDPSSSSSSPVALPPLSPSSVLSSTATTANNTTPPSTGSRTSDSDSSSDSVADQKEAIHILRPVPLRRSTTSKIQRTLSLKGKFQILTRRNTSKSTVADVDGTGREIRPKQAFRWHSHGQSMGNGMGVRVVTAS